MRLPRFRLRTLLMAVAILGLVFAGLAAVARSPVLYVATGIMVLIAFPVRS
jgi:hypothetical protein